MKLPPNWQASLPPGQRPITQPPRPATQPAPPARSAGLSAAPPPVKKQKHGTRSPRIEITLTEPESARLKDAAKRARMSVAALIRFLINGHLQQIKRRIEAHTVKV